MDSSLRWKDKSSVSFDSAQDEDGFQPTLERQIEKFNNVKDILQSALLLSADMKVLRVIGIPFVYMDSRLRGNDKVSPFDKLRVTIEKTGQIFNRLSLTTD